MFVVEGYPICLTILQQGCPAWKARRACLVRAMKHKDPILRDSSFFRCLDCIVEVFWLCDQEVCFRYAEMVYKFSDCVGWVRASKLPSCTNYS